MTFRYGKDKMTTSLALGILKGDIKTSLAASTVKQMAVSHAAVLAIANKKKAVYGINTGFGPLCNTIISSKDTTTLQRNLLLSHAVGVGDPIAVPIAKLMLILKTHALCQGFSGISKKVVDRIRWHIKQDIIPVVPEQGSLGASGDLAPLSHLFLPLLGEGAVFYKGKKTQTSTVLKKLGKRPLKLHPKAGLALINGTQFIAAHAVYVVEKLHSCLAQADLIAGMMLEGLKGSISPYESKLHGLRAYPGNQHVAARLTKLLSKSAILKSHKNCDKVQDPYSLRCVPQVHGASRSAWKHLKEAVEIEINSVTDNPVVFSERHTVSGGNFHGQPLALPLDYACLAAAEIGSISERRTYLSLEGNTDTTPKLLLKETGLNSGFMIIQYTAAALVSENKGLCFPASADSITSSLGQEDHVSMGSIGARKALKVCGNLENILAAELLCAAQAFEFQRPLKSTPLMEKMFSEVRKVIPFADKDRYFGVDLNAAADLIRSKKLLSLSEKFLRTKFEKEFERF